MITAVKLSTAIDMVLSGWRPSALLESELSVVLKDMAKSTVDSAKITKVTINIDHLMTLRLLQPSSVNKSHRQQWKKVAMYTPKRIACAVVAMVVV